jgi:hypothetical protein
VTTPACGGKNGQLFAFDNGPNAEQKSNAPKLVQLDPLHPYALDQHVPNLLQDTTAGHEPQYIPGVTRGSHTQGSVGFMIGDSDGIMIGDSDGIMIGDNDGIMIGDSDGIMIGDSGGFMIGGSDGLMIEDSDGFMLEVRTGVTLELRRVDDDDDDMAFIVVPERPLKIDTEGPLEVLRRLGLTTWDLKEVVNDL